jgi:hypothetical protein
MNRSQQSSFDRPSGAVNAPMKAIEWNVILFGPLSEKLMFPMKRKYSVRAPVLALFLCSNPATIFWAVWAVVVDAINAGLSWSFSHVEKKAYERVPSFANRNSSSAVVFPVGRIGIEASRPHSKPASICRRTVDAVSCVSVLARICNSHLDLLYRFMVRAVAGSQVPRRFRFMVRDLLEVV